VWEYTDVAPTFDKTPGNVPEYWFAPPTALSKNAGLNRFTWDLRYPAMKAMRYSYYGNTLDYIEYTLADHAIPDEFPRELLQGPLVVPGQYSVALIANGQTYRQPLTVTLDPRVQASQADLVKQLDAETSIADQMAASYNGHAQVQALREAIADRLKSLGTDATNADATKKDAADALKALDDQAKDVGDGKPEELGLGPLNRELGRLAFMIESGDSRPAALLEAGVEQYCQQLTKRLTQWRDLNQQKIQPVNEVLQKYNFAPLPVAANIPTTPSCGK
jgi:hypothetical protein